MPGHRLAHVESAVEVRRDDVLPLGGGDLERLLVDWNAGVVDEHVDAAELRRDSVESRPDALVRAHVEHDFQRAHAGGRELRARIGDVPGFRSGYRDVETVTCESERRGVADSESSARYESDFP